jgi:Fur family peroxide stress response transcriptional regulator
MDLFFQKSKESKLKITPQRIAIYNELRKSKDHPSSEIIFRRVRKVYPNISPDTVNRTLSKFAEIGIAKIVEGRGDPKRFDPIIDEHGHCRCIKCNSITDFPVQYLNKVKIPETVTERHNIISKRLILEGICNKCSKK